MCQFPRLPSAGYVFTDGWRRITGVGFSHSEIRGSKAVQRLTAAYRSRPRPSSAPGAKASTVCPYYLDGELLPRPKARSVLYAAAPEGTDSAKYPFWLLCSFQASPRPSNGGLPLAVPQN